MASSSSSGQHVVNIDELSASTKEKLLKLPPSSSEPYIYRVPNNMRVSNEQYFTPQIVSIGPIHYQNEKLRANEHLKERYLAEFLQHTEVSLNECYKLILDNEGDLRNRYADVIELNSENFVKMVLVDAAFLLMILVYNAEGILFADGTLVSRTDRIFGNPRMIKDLRYDLLLLENQLPFFILEELYKLSKLHNILKIESSLLLEEVSELSKIESQLSLQNVLDKLQKIHIRESPFKLFISEKLSGLSKLYNTHNRESSRPLESLSSIINRITDLTLFLNYTDETAMTSTMGYMAFIMLGFVGVRTQPVSNAVHILDLLRSFLIPDPALVVAWKICFTTNIPGAKELYKAGVKIKVGSKKNMFDIRFHNGILEIPPLEIEDSTELVFRNLLAFELCHYSKKRIFSDYFEMMRLLTLSSVDAELLIQNGVIINGLGNAQRVSTLFQNISTGNLINWSDFQYSDIMEDLNRYYKLNPHKWEEIVKDWMKTLKEKYFKAPWAICSVSAAVFLLVLTIVQTVFTILQVVLPK